MAQAFTKAKLSASTDGRGIKIVATATLGNTIHTAVSGSTAFDEVWLYAYNGHTTTVTLTIELGGATSPDDQIVITLPNKTGRFLVVDGAILNNAKVVTAFASVTNVIVITGFVNQIV